MRILLYSYNYHPEPIGIAPLMTELAEGLAQRGHQVRVITGMPNYPQRRVYPEYQGKWYLTEIQNGVSVQRSYVWARSNPSLVNRILLDGSFVVSSLPQALRGWKPDVVLATVPPLPVCVPAVFLKYFYRCPLVLNVQDILPDGAIQVGLLRNQVLIRVFQALEKFAYRNATRISVIAEGFEDNLRAKGVPPSQMAMIPNWVDTEFIRPLPRYDNDFRRQHGLGEKFVVLYSGNIALTQGLGTAIMAAKRLQKYPDIVFAVVGEPRALRVLQRKYQPGDNVLMLEFQPREKLPEMLAAADVGLVVQKKKISFNMPSKIPVLLASGRAIVASVSSGSSAAKALEASGGGMVVHPENPTALAKAVSHLYHNREQGEAMGQRGREHALEQYNFDRALDRYETLFSELVAFKQKFGRF